MQSQNRQAYFNRIHLSEDISVSEEGLESLHRAQAFAIPFENFDIFLGRPITLETDALFAKMIYGGRGGYCFELNTLFFEILQSVGFHARQLMARVHLTGKPTGREQLRPIFPLAPR